MSSEIANFITNSIGRAVWSGRIWPDVAGVPEDVRELAHVARFGKQADAARMVEGRVIPFLPARLRRAFERLAEDLYESEAAGVAAWNAALAASLQAQARRLLKEATASAEREAKALEA